MHFPNAFRTNLRDLHFLLWEQFRIQDDILESSHFEDFDRNTVSDLLNAARSFAYDCLGPAYQQADREGCTKEADDCVRVPAVYHENWRRFRELGWGTLGAPTRYGGLGAPYAVTQVINEILMGADPSFMIYSGFCTPGLYLIDRFGSEWLRETFCHGLADNRLSACLCMTEPQAGTDLGEIRTKARRCDDGTYLLSGTKIFISAGMHDLTGNTVYIVLARVEGASPGTRGLSCFVVPRYLVDEDGNPTEDNNIRCVRLEDKMGLHGCATAQLAFGEPAPSRGYLLGERENIGLQQLMTMMNQARITTGVFSLGMASSAYLNAAEYAGERIQGTDVRQFLNPKAPKQPIVRHADVRRMLIEMKSRVEGCRTLMVKAAVAQTRAMALEGYLADAGADDEAAGEEYERLSALSNLLTPLLKAYISDQAWQVMELAIQVHGGYGYIRDYPVEQYTRDVKIMSIWEGTNFIQSADLVRDKLSMGRMNKGFRAYLDEIETFLAETADNAAFANERTRLAESLQTLRDIHALFSEWIPQRKMELIFVYSTRFLEMMGEVTVAWLLLDAAVTASCNGIDAEPESGEAGFYSGKIAAARYFCRNILPGVAMKADVIRSEDLTAFESTEAMFAAN